MIGTGWRALEGGQQRVGLEAKRRRADHEREVDTTSRQLLDLARCVLPSAPCVIDVVFEDGGSFPVSLLGEETENDVVCLHAPRRAVRDGTRLLARVSDEQGGGYEVELEIVASFFHFGEEALVHAAVTAVRRRKGRRLAKRVAVGEKATARVGFSGSHPAGAELEVRMVDVSATGLAFSTPQTFDPGDLLTVNVWVADRAMAIDSRVVRCQRAPYDRFRVGCEIRNLTPQDQQALSQLAATSDGHITVDRRSQPPIPTTGQSSLNNRLWRTPRATT